MSANGPFTPSVLRYDPPRTYVMGLVPTPGSVLDTLSMFREFYLLVEKSGQQRLYNVSPVTVFVPRNFVFDPKMTVSDAIHTLRMLTVVKRLDRTALRYSQIYVLKTMATPFDLLVETDINTVSVNSVPVTESFDCTNGTVHVLG